MQQIQFEELLVRTGKLSPRDLERALIAKQELGGKLGQVLIRLGLVSESDVLNALSESLDVPVAMSSNLPSTHVELEGLQIDFLRFNHVYPIAVSSDHLSVAMAYPQDEFVVKAMHLATGKVVKRFICTEGDIESAWEKALELNVADGIVEAEPETDTGEFVEHLKDLASEAPVIRLVNTIIGRVIDLRASDIHLEPFDDGLHVRYRVDGVIQTTEIISPAHSAAVSSRVKLLAHLDIAERRLPQDGRIRTRVKGRELDLRVSTVPTVHGESVVMRVLDRASVKLSLEKMGFSPDCLARFNTLLAKPHGVLLVTGPTGSGKTTTLYAALSKLDAEAQKIITVEDPVEYQLEGINQIQVHPQINLTFANALRSILRQDPDIIMIGEMRDGETAQIAVQSALTGHLVLSTLHTNTAASAVVRMQDMGVERYLITSAVNGVLAQRLVRTLCEDCKAEEELNEPLRQSSGLDRFLGAHQAVYRPVGCEACRGSGYRGRTGIHELMVLDESLRSAIIEGLDANALHTLATKSGMVTLYEDGLRKVASGVTSLDEVMRVTQEQSNA